MQQQSKAESKQDRQKRYFLADLETLAHELFIANRRCDAVCNQDNLKQLIVDGLVTKDELVKEFASSVDYFLDQIQKL